LGGLLFATTSFGLKKKRENKKIIIIKFLNFVKFDSPWLPNIVLQQKNK
jgi:hypothetical protein